VTTPPVTISTEILPTVTTPSVIVPAVTPPTVSTPIDTITPISLPSVTKAPVKIAPIALPTATTPRGALPVIPGQPPLTGESLPGCAFAPRCPHARPTCTDDVPALVDVADERAAACPVTSPSIDISKADLT